ncbi:hypothetical protein POREN0001_1617 [Porphyromonas endodontalis ATCC 35406]|uniref:Uncharacterized protein n=1 Tax=Porphyromonas endodontalis (strain ATCC 35406 / DSM 24491 / JCM 8526 / CCUG 16442 / BCRC 14492 / NCTC 13058 / HG 370) TaxID=553175 RepID=C3J7M0_POREA|nr:hypothetical protein POREN0001_1617 [Porphyromonas endodontalis ATCC 35406]
MSKSLANIKMSTIGMRIMGRRKEPDQEDGKLLSIQEY